MKTSLLRRCCTALCILTAAEAARGGLNFNFNPDAGTPQYVVDAFGVAGGQWSAVLGGDFTVNVDVGFASLPGGVIGQTSYSFVQQGYSSVVAALNASADSADDASAYAHLQPGPTYSRLINRTTDNPNGPNSATTYVNSLSPVSLTRANAKLLGFLGADPGSDAAIRFNSDVSFDFNPADGTTSGHYDFVTMASHELGHALGFLSIVDSLEQASAVAIDLPATVLDLFRFSTASVGAGTGFIDCSADTRNKFFSLDGGATSVAGLSRGEKYGGGYQASHWQEFTWMGLMDPTIFTGMQRGISQTDLRAFDVIGYRRIPEPSGAALLVLASLAAGARARRSFL